jgi:DnaK suppressor protein
MRQRRDIDLAALRQALIDRRTALEAEDGASEDDRAPVDLDPSTIGRHSRIDALQGQAMAEATHDRRMAEIQRITAALERMEDGDYGVCLSCDKKIPAKRLELDPAVPTCVHCAARAEDHRVDHVHLVD